MAGNLERPKIFFFPLLKSSGMKEALTHRLYMDIEWKLSTTKWQVLAPSVWMLLLTAVKKA